MPDPVSSSKIKVRAVNQVAIIVKDVREVAEKYWTRLAIGPWDIFSVESPSDFKGNYLGKPAKYGCKYGICQCGNCILKLVQPTSGDSIFHSYINIHGEGLHHIQYNTGSVDEARQHVRILNDLGFPLLMDESYGDGYLAYIDTLEALGCILALGKKSGSISGPDNRFPADTDSKSPAKIKIEGITQVGLIVNDLLKTIKNYWDILGIGPWGMVGCKPPLIHDLTYKQKPGEFTSYVGYADAGGVEVEPIEPLSGKNMYQDFLDSHGQGIQHLQFIVSNISETTQIMRETGFSKLMSLGFSDGEAIYYDTASELKAVWEAFQLPKNMPEVETYP